MKIVRLQAENVKRLVAVEIAPDGNLVEITGRNGAGKSSVLDAIWYALAGKATLPAEPIRQGQERAVIRLELGDLTVTRTFRRRPPAAGKSDERLTTEITVENAEGARFMSPQGMLDGLVDTLSFDPLAFARASSAEQYRMLAEVIGVDVFAADAATASDFAERRDYNRAAREMRTAAASIHVPPDVPTKRVSVPLLMAELTEADEHNASREQRAANASRWRDEARAYETEAVQLEGRASKLRLEAEDLDELAKAKRRSAEGAVSRAEAEAENIPDAIDVAPIRERIAGAETANAALDAKERRRILEADATKAEGQANDLTERMEKRAEDVAAKVRAADLPIPGLTLAQGQVTLNGVPLEQASDAERLRISCAIAMRRHAKLRVLRVRDGSLLDSASLKQIAELAKDADYQVWVERVDESGKIGVVIEDGQVVQPEADEQTGLL